MLYGPAVVEAHLLEVEVAKYPRIVLELINRERYPTRAAAIRSIGDYIDNLHNIQRRHSHLGYMSPSEFELRSQLQQTAA